MNIADLKGINDGVASLNDMRKEQALWRIEAGAGAPR
jgi:hypothetical protein